MRTTARLLTGTALAVASLGALASPAAYAGDFGTLEVYPSPAAPGDTVTVNTTACGKKGRGVGDAASLGAGEFKLSPGTHKEVAVGQFKVPAHIKPGTYAIAVACDNGKAASGDLVVKHSGGGGHDTGGRDTGGHDSGGTGGHEQGGTGGHLPSGHVKTGVGGSVGPDTTQIAAGVAVLAASAAGGVWLLRRRASGAQGS
ncbi:hypothetical protein QWM81_16800 [Streptomyces ficellus]|uniref:LPXTG cell wall anchor domain-containing protein n=1 Tax=Streptomyces ficellus TaxID=1977088 RepID=A0ABT7Z855_9ACTN|nr:hypothetical protein [Streptomyces ficellus]MDN3295682.1 hypothetical protein [Streptomyces ficellus]